MKARFQLDPTHVRVMSERMAMRTGSAPNYSILSESSEGGGQTQTLVCGDAQDVMFLIGEIAANGEDGLTSVQ